MRIQIRYKLCCCLVLSVLTLRCFAMTLSISSPDFHDNSLIPSKFTCEGENIPPTLNWQNPPSNTESFVLIVDDPDASRGTWVHWLVFNLPAEARILTDQIPESAIEGVNSYGKNEYSGPCPPTGMHRYFFKLYALDTTLTVTKRATKQDLESAMQGHILEQTQVIGLYKKQG